MDSDSSCIYNCPVSYINSKMSEPSSPPPTASPKWRRRAEARPAEIVQAAYEIFAEKGFAAARLDDIAKRAGVSKGALYLYFETKQDIFEAVVKDAVAPNIGDTKGAFEHYFFPCIVDAIFAFQYGVDLFFYLFQFLFFMEYKFKLAQQLLNQSGLNNNSGKPSPFKSPAKAKSAPMALL